MNVRNRPELDSLSSLAAIEQDFTIEILLMKATWTKQNLQSGWIRVPGQIAMSAPISLPGRSDFQGSGIIPSNQEIPIHHVLYLTVHQSLRFNSTPEALNSACIQLVYYTTYSL